MSFIVIADKVGVQIPNNLSSIPIKYLFEEFKDFLRDTFEEEPIAEILTLSSLVKPSDATLLLDGRLYVKNNEYFVQSGGAWFSITPKFETFKISVSPTSDGIAVVNALEALLNYYMPIYGLTFMHTASYIKNGKVCAIHAFGGSGKSETMLHALYNGADFISDDLAIFNIDGQIYPYPRKISLHGYNFSETELEMFSLNKKHYKLIQWLKNHPGRITNRLYERWKREFYIRFSYHEITRNTTPNKFYDVDSHYWLESKGVNGISAYNHNDFCNRMIFCMQNEFCSYINYNGYFGATLPFWEDVKQRYLECLNNILKSISVKRASIDECSYSKIQDLISRDMN